MLENNMFLCYENVGNIFSSHVSAEARYWHGWTACSRTNGTVEKKKIGIFPSTSENVNEWHFRDNKITHAILTFESSQTEWDTRSTQNVEERKKLPTERISSINFSLVSLLFWPKFLSLLTYFFLMLHHFNINSRFFGHARALFSADFFSRCLLNRAGNKSTWKKLTLPLCAPHRRVAKFFLLFTPNVTRSGWGLNFAKKLKWPDDEFEAHQKYTRANIESGD